MKSVTMVYKKLRNFRKGNSISTDVNLKQSYKQIRTDNDSIHHGWLSSVLVYLQKDE